MEIASAEVVSEPPQVEEVINQVETVVAVVPRERTLSVGGCSQEEIESSVLQLVQ